jgi:hypothetical protein
MCHVMSTLKENLEVTRLSSNALGDDSNKLAIDEADDEGIRSPRHRFRRCQKLRNI